MNSIKQLLGAMLAVMVAATACKSTKEVATTSTSAVKTAESTSGNPENSLIWKVSGKDLNGDSYIFGTIHVIGEDDFFFPKGTEKAFEQSKHLMLELDMNEPGLAMKVAMAAMMEDQTMEDLLEPEEYKRYKIFLKDTLGVSGMEAMAADRMKPVLGMSLAYPKMISGKVESYEGRFTKMAKKQDMEVSGLEEVEDQIQALNSIPLDEQVTMLMEMVDSFSVQKKIFNDMILLYKKQDLANLFNMMNQYEELSNVQSDLLDKRNTRWIPKIIAQAKKEPTFVAVGAAHLYGEKGVIQLLKKEGYSVVPLPQ